MTVRGWSTLAAGAVLAAWVVGAVLFWWQYQQAIADQARLVTTWAPAAAHASTLARAQASASEALNNAVIRTELRRPDQLERLLGQLQQAGRRLDALLDHEPAERTLLARARTSQDAWLQQDLDPTLEALAEGNAARAASITASQGSADRTQAMLEDSTALQSRTQARLLAQGRVMSASAASLGEALFIAMTVLIIAILAGSVAVRLRVVRPIDWLRVHVRQAAADSGHQHPIPVVGPAEIAALAKDAEGLRRQLVAEIDEARAARGALDSHAPLVAEVRGRLHGQQPPSLDGMEVFASTHPIEGVIGGDWWQFAPRPDGTWCLVLADVSGHGWGCGVVAMQMQAVMDSWLRTEEPIERALRAASSLLRSGAHTIPMVVIELDFAAGCLRYANAGHPPPIVIDARGGVRELTRTGPLLSCLEATDSWWTCRMLPWALGDALIAYTDGLLPAANPRGGDDPKVLSLLATAIPGDIRRDAHEFGHRLLADIRASGDEWADDATLLVITRPLPVQAG